MSAICRTTGPQSHHRGPEINARARHSGNGIHQPAEHERRGDESAKHDRAGPELLSWIIAKQHAEDERHEEREHHEQEEVAGHLRPSAMS